MTSTSLVSPKMRMRQPTKKASLPRPPDERLLPFLELYAQMVADRVEGKLAEPQKRPKLIRKEKDREHHSD